MFVLKAFATHSEFVNNVPGVLSPIGEISTQALTFAREKGYYKSTLSADIDLISFTSLLGNTQYQLTQDLVDQIIKVISHIYTVSLNTQGQIYSDQLLQDLILNYSHVGIGFTCGNIVNNGTYYAPEWVSWESTDNSIIGTGNSITVWLSDPSFQLQYDDYEIVVIPPITNLDDFFKQYLSVTGIVNSITPTDLMTNVQAAKNGYPETIISAKVHNYIDKYNPNNTFPTVWNLLIYGAAGNNIDIIQNALINYILTNSTHTREQWTVIFPDIFKRTEFSIIPNWSNYAIPNKTLQVGIYSPTTTVSNILTALDTLLQNYPAAHINANTTVTITPYKSLTLFSVGSPDNKYNKFKITDLFPDYISVPSTSIDFNRMSLDTQEWALLIMNMILVAETMGTKTSLPPGMSRTTRNGILYVVSSYKDIDYLVAAKMSLPTPI
jgi:hypothetical protein